MEIIKKILRSLKSNLWLKIAALIFACILWSYVISVTNPVRPKTVREIPVSFVNMEEVDSKGLAFTEELPSVLSNVTVTVSAQQNNHGMITKNTVKATVDLSVINGPGTYELAVNAEIDSAIGTVVSVNPSKITVTTEALVRKFIPVEAVTMGTAKAGYYMGTPEISSDQIEISGPSSVVSSITKASCYIFINDLTEDVNSSYDLTLLNDQNVVIEETLLQDYVPSVIVSMKVYKTKDVPIETNGVIKNAERLKEGYAITGISVSPQTVTIAAGDDMLSKVNFVELDQISVENADKTFTVYTTIKPIDGVYNISERDVEITVTIEKISR